ncbi:MAG: serine hydrolase [Minisyncoccia bacterium]
MPKFIVWLSNLFTMKRLEYFLISAILLTGSFFVGLNYEKNKLNNYYLSYIDPVRESDSSYKFIKPLLAYKIPPATADKEFQPLYNNLLQFEAKQKSAGNITDISIFLSMLDEGRWIGVNENEKYTPASLMKVVLMMAYFKKSEHDNRILNQRLVYSKVFDDLAKTSPFDDPSDLQIGKSYTVDELIQRMIVDSDNGAITLLLTGIDSASIDDVYNTLSVANDVNSEYTISPRDYSLFFRVLYSGTYLYKSLSEKALSLLSETTFNDGLVAGVPSGMTVAHKYGEHVIASGMQVTGIELHDCGIIYYQPSPYFLCVMTRGTNLDKLKTVISGVSNIIYNDVSGSNKK